jgi:hypothetical protein
MSSHTICCRSRKCHSLLYLVKGWVQKSPQLLTRTVCMTTVQYGLRYLLRSPLWKEKSVYVVCIYCVCQLTLDHIFLTKHKSKTNYLFITVIWQVLYMYLPFHNSETVPAKQQMGLVSRSLDKKAHRVQFQMNRTKAILELPGVTAVRQVNEDSESGVCICVSCVCCV